jgi:hypothetical protein
MQFKSFHSVVVGSEVNYRSFTLVGHPKIPDGEYGLVQNYCDDIKCDCRRVIILVYKGKDVFATIGYGWEEYEFYRKWARGSLNKKEIIEYMGPCLHDQIINTSYSEEILKYVTAIVMDESLKRRIIQNYKLFRHIISQRN